MVLREAHEHGGNTQAVMEPDGFPLWVADVEPGSVHDLTVAREHVLGARYWAASQLELAELLQFLREWLAGEELHTALEAFVGTASYDLRQLRADLDRFTFLLGGNDGEPLFHPEAR